MATTTDLAPLAPAHRVHWYEIRCVLGTGRCGITYDAVDTNLERRVVIKELAPPLLCRREAGADVVTPLSAESREDFEWGRRRFIDEARSLAQLQHPGVVRVLSSFELNDTAYMVMDHQSGRTLAEALREGRIAGEEEILAFIGATLSALDSIHAAGCVHRDIKPANLLTLNDNSPILVDFGTSHLIRSRGHGDKDAAPRAFAPLEYYGEPGANYRYGPTSDVYGVAAVLHEALLGTAPADARERKAVVAAGGADPLLTSTNAGRGRYSEVLLSAIDGALALEPDDRPPDVARWRTTFPPPLGRRTHRGSQVQQPADPPPAAADSGSHDEAAAAARFGGLRVLVIDDEKFAVSLIERVMQRLGISQVTSVNGALAGFDCMDQASTDQRAPFDVVLCDLKMPEIDGIEFMRRLGQREERPSVVLMSGVDQKVLQTAGGLAAEHGLRFLGCLAKPPTPEPLAALLDEHCDATRPPTFAAGGAGMLSPDAIKAGLARDQLVMYLQPKVDTRTRRVVGTEALARWQGLDGRILGPGQFIPVAEEHDLITDLTHAVVEATLAEQAQLVTTTGPLGISINISAECLDDLNFPDYMHDVATRAGVPPTSITLEITESRVARDARSATEVLTRLRLRDFTLSIDDFGTGFASLDQLKTMPLTELKIDQGFVNGASHDADLRAILETSVRLANDLGLRIVAEGVETAEDWDLVTTLGCHTVQGYYVAKPMPASKLPDWIEDWNRRWRP